MPRAVWLEGMASKLAAKPTAGFPAGSVVKARLASLLHSRNAFQLKLLGKMTGDHPVPVNRTQRRGFNLAPIFRVAAAGMEIAPFRRVRGVGYFPLQNDPLRTQARIRLGN